MKIEKYDNYKELIPLYISRGLEVHDGDFYNKHVFSLIMKNEEGATIGASTCTQLDENYIIEALVIAENETQKGYGKYLLNNVLNEIKELNGTNIYLVAKDPKFFEKNGFIIIEKEDAPDFSDCFMCPDYKVCCFPKILKYIGE